MSKIIGKASLLVLGIMLLAGLQVAYAQASAIEVKGVAPKLIFSNDPGQNTATIKYKINEDLSTGFTLKIYDGHDNIIRNLYGIASISAGTTIEKQSWNAKNDDGAPVAAGTYTYKFEGTGFDTITGTIMVRKQTPKLTTRVIGDPFAYMINQIQAAKTDLNKIEALTKKIRKLCQVVEVSDVTGCDSSVQVINDALKGYKEDSTTYQPDSNTIIDEIHRLDADFQQDYGTEMDRSSAVMQPKPVSILDKQQYRQRALINPYKQLLDWVGWMKEGSFFPKTIRNNKSAGAPLIIKLTERFCDRLETPFTDGCKDAIDVMKEATKDYSTLENDPNLNSNASTSNNSRHSMLTTLQERLTDLSQEFAARYGGEDRENAVMPKGNLYYDFVIWQVQLVKQSNLKDYQMATVKNGGVTDVIFYPRQLQGKVQQGDFSVGVLGDPFKHLLEINKLFDSGSFYAADIRERYSKQMISLISEACDVSGGIDGCNDEINTLNDIIKTYKDKRKGNPPGDDERSNNQSRENIMGAFNEILTRLDGYYPYGAGAVQQNDGTTPPAEDPQQDGSEGENL